MDSMHVFDIVCGTWSTMESLPTPRYSHAFAAVGTRLYAVGGAIGFMKYLDSVEVLDTLSGTWSTAPPLSTPRFDHTCAVVGSLLYVVGGQKDGQCVSWVEVLDTASGTWLTLDRMFGNPLFLDAPSSVHGTLLVTFGCR
eukprot:TRINITY_DN10813_c0_g1_i3.p2 TRINITY_DN10813_c0_g1~~TRINITY_DN10813_c0_g1_i3.p2  ORF type:complete len:140 (+),score=15.13 TRINITY_DN10813_c0_g1_i3:453-872(+)